MTTRNNTVFRKSLEVFRRAWRRVHFPRRRGRRARDRSPDRHSPLPLLSRTPAPAADEGKDKDEDKDDGNGAVWLRRPPGATIRPVVLTDSPSELSLNMASAATGPVN